MAKAGEWISLEEVVKGDVIRVKEIDRSSDGLLVARVCLEGDDAHLVFYGGLNYRLSRKTKVFKET